MKNQWIKTNGKLSQKLAFNGFEMRIIKSYRSRQTLSVDWIESRVDGNWLEQFRTNITFIWNTTESTSLNDNALHFHNNELKIIPIKVLTHKVLTNSMTFNERPILSGQRLHPNPNHSYICLQKHWRLSKNEEKRQNYIKVRELKPNWDPIDLQIHFTIFCEHYFSRFSRM